MCPSWSKYYSKYQKVCVILADSWFELVFLCCDWILLIPRLLNSTMHYPQHQLPHGHFWSHGSSNRNANERLFWKSRRNGKKHIILKVWHHHPNEKIWSKARQTHYSWSTNPLPYKHDLPTSDALLHVLQWINLDAEARSQVDWTRDADNNHYLEWIGTWYNTKRTIIEMQRL